MKKLIEKIKNKSGETIGEVLVALLISALALMMLAGAIGSSSKLIENSRKKEGNYYAANEVLSKRGVGELPSTVSIDNGKVTITETDGGTGGISQIKDVTYYINNEYGNTPIVSYK